jgi:hypothetical protein
MTAVGHRFGELFRAGGAVDGDRDGGYWLLSEEGSKPSRPQAS